MRRSTDLSELGFHFDADDEWMDRIRQAEESGSLGRIGPYELLEEVSRGGQGIVFKARQPGTERAIAVKRMLAGSFSTTSMRVRFEREILASAALNHPNIVTVYGMEVADGLPLLAMEWIEGVPIDEWAREPRDPEEKLGAFLRVCDAVQHAHSRGILHRDLKPTNVLIDDSGQPHVLDFGLAKSAHQVGGDESRSADFLGTPAYASPEQLRHGVRDLDARSDVYSLGVVLYEMLTGERPHRFGGSLVTLLEAIEGEPPSRPSAADPRLGRELDTIVSKALAVQREERYASVGDLAADVRRYLAGEPVRAMVPSTWYLLRKLVQRNRLAAVFAATIFVMTVGFTVHAAVQNAHLEREVANANEMMRRMEDWLVYVPDSVLQHAALNPDYVPPELTSRSAVREALLRASKNRE